MKYKIIPTRNKQYTLLVNDISIYSHYEPKQGAKNWIEKEIDLSKDAYFLIGLGIGYHIEALLNCLNSEKKIIVYYFEDEEYRIFKKYGLVQFEGKSNLIITNTLKDIKFEENIQILIPDVWIRAIGQMHPLFPILEVMKNTQRSYKINKDLLRENFNLNYKLGDSFYYPQPRHEIACLVAAGPSLNETVHWLKKIEHSVDIYVCGAALNVIEKQGITPMGVFITDANDTMQKQLLYTKYVGALFYLSTANHTAIRLHRGKRYILLQEGYLSAEKYAKANNATLIETGGSVSTTIFSYIEKQNYQAVILFGQDMGFKGEYTHAQESTSGKTVQNTEKLRKLKSNDDDYIYTNPTLYAFFYWFSEKLKNSNLKVYNTAKNGAKLINAPYINELQLIRIVGDRGIVV
ncbi:6-hydroxymethylpterin diphosphokinase MptE-like protein [Lysinibacillus sp. 1P01SD]|uniref:6-hydroxymethylpterin diphosphokinase MptE-like protein n=1 Tax=Lysinibacillus sp. 1P01SD TaxID=3132285 RepID=UPI0039A39F31